MKLQLNWRTCWRKVEKFRRFWWVKSWLWKRFWIIVEKLCWREEESKRLRNIKLYRIWLRRKLIVKLMPCWWKYKLSREWFRKIQSRNWRSNQSNKLSRKSHQYQLLTELKKTTRILSWAMFLLVIKMKWQGKWLKLLWSQMHKKCLSHNFKGLWKEAVQRKLVWVELQWRIDNQRRETMK